MGLWLGLWGGPLSVLLYSWVWAGASRRAEETLQSQVGHGKTRTAFLWAQQLAEVVWVHTPTLRNQACAFLKCFLKGWLLFLVICTDSHVAALLTWLFFYFGLMLWRAVGVVWQQGVACGGSPVAEILRGYMSREHWCKQKKEGRGLFFPFPCNSKHWTLPAASVSVTLGKLT